MANRQQVNTLPLRTISDFKSKLKGGGARPNLFEVELTFPSIVAVQDENEVIENSRFLVKAAALPASTVAPIDIPFRGRILKLQEIEHLKPGQSLLLMTLHSLSDPHLRSG